MAWEPTITVSVARKVNLGNYESQEVFIQVKDLPFEADDEQIQQAMGTAKRVYQAMTDELKEKVRRVREGA